MRTITAQTPRVRMCDYKKYFFKKNDLSLHEKINVRSNILKKSIPLTERLLN